MESQNCISVFSTSSPISVEWGVPSGLLGGPSARQDPGGGFETGELTQRMKVLGKARARVIDSRLLYELAPRLVREKRERTKFAAIFEMAQDFACSAFLILGRGIARDCGPNLTNDSCVFAASR